MKKKIVNDAGSSELRCVLKQDYCPAGMVLIDDKCIIKKCQCDNGFAAIGVQCPGHNELACIECDTGFHGLNLISVNENENVGLAGYAGGYDDTYINETGYLEKTICRNT